MNKIPLKSNKNVEDFHRDCGNSSTVSRRICSVVETVCCHSFWATCESPHSCIDCTDACSQTGEAKILRHITGQIEIIIGPSNSGILKCIVLHEGINACHKLSLSLEYLYLTKSIEHACTSIKYIFFNLFNLFYTWLGHFIYHINF